MKLTRMMDLQRFAEGPEGTKETAPPANDAQATDAQPEGDPATNQNGGEKPESKTFSQDELDAIISKRLARERKAWETQMEEEKKKAAMSETERLQAEKDAAEKKATDAMDRAHRVLITAEAKAVAAQLGINPDRLTYAVKLADLDGIEVDDEGSADTGAIQKAMEAVLEDLPELKVTKQRDIGGGTNPGGRPPTNADMNAFIRRSTGR